MLWTPTPAEAGSNVLPETPGPLHVPPEPPFNNVFKSNEGDPAHMGFGGVQSAVVILQSVGGPEVCVKVMNPSVLE